MSATRRSPPPQVVGSHDTTLAALIRILQAEQKDDFAGATSAIAALEGTQWEAWENFKLVAAQWRLPEAMDLADRILEPVEPPVTELVRFEFGNEQPYALGTGWRHRGDGEAINLPGSVRLVGAGGTGSRFEADLSGLDNAAGTWIEFVVARNSSTEGDCRLDFSDGVVREVVYLEPTGLMLLSGGEVLRFPTHRPHLYGLWVRGQESRLYADGQPVLESHGMAAAGTKQICFGVQPLAGTGYMESLWSVVRVCRMSAELERPSILPASYPFEVWTSTIEALAEHQLWPEALAAVVCTNLSHPGDPRAQSLASEMFERAAASASGGDVGMRAARLLPLGQRVAVHPADSEPLVKCEEVGVRFWRSAPRTLRGHIRRLSRKPKTSDHFWALRNVSFELSSGEMLAIIGRNGAGKSTLLNVLADLIEPEEGRVHIEGRPMLLSMGSGFSHALSGRENIYLSGLYLGLTKREIQERFDEIVEFAELWDAIDRPFRTYSSGMMSRLQFALATTVSPDILFLDELLGAGDAAFVKKAQARMHQLLRRAHAVITVTHDTEFVRNYCSKAILLEHGEVLYSGSPDKAVLSYLDLLTRVPNRSAARSSGGDS